MANLNLMSSQIFKVFKWVSCSAEERPWQHPSSSGSCWLVRGPLRPMVSGTLKADHSLMLTSLVPLGSSKDLPGHNLILSSFSLRTEALWDTHRPRKPLTQEATNTAPHCSEDNYIWLMSTKNSPSLAAFLSFQIALPSGEYCTWVKRGRLWIWETSTHHPFYSLYIVQRLES